MPESMRADRFWAIIDRTAKFADDRERQLEELEAILSALPATDIEAFEGAFNERLAACYTWDLWAAAYIIHGGSSDDAFEYFRHWLISSGRATFEAALAKADDLAELIPEDQEEELEFEEYAYVAGDAWAGLTDGDLDGFAKGYFQQPGGDPKGTPFEEDDDHLAKRFPKLWTRFGENPIG
jgi:Protein of unknown function (DUF4240)